jgi:hypothetical protein
MTAALSQLTNSGATERRGGSMLHVHLRDADPAQAKALLARMAATRTPPVRATPEPIDGSPWERHDVPTRCVLYAVWGRSSSDVYAAGGHGAVIHFDGQRWQREALDTESDVMALWGRGHEVFAGLDDGVIMRRSDGEWRADSDRMPSAVLAIGGNDEHVVAGGDAFLAERGKHGWKVAEAERIVTVFAAASEVFAVDRTGGVYRAQPGPRKKVANWPVTDGVEWPLIPNVGTTRVNEAPWLSPALDEGWRPKNFVRVGNDVILSGGRRTVLYVEQGLVAKSESLGGDADMHGLWASSDGVVYVVGERGTVLRRPRSQ